MIVSFWRGLFVCMFEVDWRIDLVFLFAVKSVCLFEVLTLFAPCLLGRSSSSVVGAEAEFKITLQVRFLIFNIVLYRFMKAFISDICPWVNAGLATNLVVRSQLNFDVDHLALNVLLSNYAQTISGKEVLMMIWSPTSDQTKEPIQHKSQRRTYFPPISLSLGRGWSKGSPHVPHSPVDYHLKKCKHDHRRNPPTPSWSCLGVPHHCCPVVCQSRRSWARGRSHSLAFQIRTLEF